LGCHVASGRDPGIDLALRARISPESASTVAENEIAILASRPRLQDCQRRSAQRNFTFAPPFGTPRRQRNQRLIEADLGPRQASDFVPPCAGQHEELNKRAIVAVGTGVPDFPQLLVGGVCAREDRPRPPGWYWRTDSRGRCRHA